MKHLTLFGVLACLPIGLVMAHHSINAEYDLEVPVSLDGVITRVEWQSPHIWYYIDVVIYETKCITPIFRHFRVCVIMIG